MKVLIIEDEPKAAQGLQQMLEEINPAIEVLAVLESVKEAVAYLSDASGVQLIFSDIQLEDGLSFEIFEKVPVQCPIIFITAYNQYAIEAFQTNGIGYLLKPIDKEQLEKTLHKLEQLTPGLTVEKLLALAHATAEQKTYKSRFLIKIGERIRSVPIEEVLAFFSLEKVTYLFTTHHRRYVIDHSLDYLETVIDPAQFFRINRKYIVSIDACKDIQSWSSSRLKVKVEGLETYDTVVARDRYRNFKEWLDQ